MDTPAAPPPPSLPQKVARNFVKTYYSTLSTNPSVLYCFYRPESQASQAFLDEVQPAPVCGKELRDQLTRFFSEHLQGCRVDFDEGSVDAQAGSDETVFVMVFGVVKSLNEVAPDRRFVQSFLLRFMENRYFILNDMFRFTDPSPGGRNPRKAPAVVPGFEDDDVTETMNGEVSKAEDKEASAASETRAAAVPEEDGDQDAELENDAAPASASVEASNDEENQGALNVATESQVPMSWAKIASRRGEAPPNSGSPVRKPRVGSSTSPSPATGSQANADVTKNGSSRSTMNGGASEPNAAKRASVPGIYIRNVAADTTDAEIEAVFSGEWGKAEKVLSHAAKGYAFVEFASSDIVKMIVNGEVQEEWLLRGERLVVEERRERDPSRSSSKRKPPNGYARNPNAKGGARGRNVRGEPRRSQKSDGERPR